jgi:hypothetical protein
MPPASAGGVNTANVVKSRLFFTQGRNFNNPGAAAMAAAAAGFAAIRKNFNMK